MAGEHGQGVPAAAQVMKKASPEAAPVTQSSIEPLIDQNQKPQQQHHDNPSTSSNLEKAKGLLDEAQQEEKQGFSIGSALGQSQQKELPKEQPKQASFV